MYEKEELKPCPFCGGDPELKTVLGNLTSHDSHHYWDAGGFYRPLIHITYWQPIEPPSEGEE